MDSSPAVIVDKLSKIYPLYAKPVDRMKEALHPFRKQYHHNFTALDNISFSIARGETVGIIGRNGSGKSTLLKILTGVLTPSGGTATINGRTLALLELGSGFNPELSGIENIYFNTSLYGVSRDETTRKLDRILAFAGIGEFVHQPIKTYSSGMIVRLAFAVIANMDADILIIDEALSVGDASFVQKCMRFLRDFIKRGTLLFVSHDTQAVLSLCSRAIWLDNGTMREDGTPKEVAESYLESLFDCDSEKQEWQEDKPALSTSADTSAPRDMRQDWINNSRWRNDVEIFAFDPEAPSFGDGGATITSVALYDENGAPLNWIVGGEMCRLTITAQIHQQISSLIVGFYLKDRLGQALFGENTYNFTLQSPPDARRGDTISASFEFRMPILPAGDYSFTTALAEGSQESHRQHHWVHDALILKSHSSSASTGLLGLPMRSISLEIQ